MALISCKECGKEMSSKADACPGCGAKPPKKTSVFTWIIGGFFTLVVISMVSNAVRRSEAPAVASSAAATQTASAPAPKRWEYWNETDQMSGKPIRAATVDADDKLDFRFPYNGGSTATLNVLQHPKHGLTIGVSVTKGHFLCRSHDCPLSVRFDDDAPIRVSGAPPADHSTTRIFLNGEKKLLNRLRSAKITRVEATFYQEGARVMTFNTGGLNFN